jgi:hypothetical protein
MPHPGFHNVEAVEKFFVVVVRIGREHRLFGLTKDRSSILAEN